MARTAHRREAPSRYVVAVSGDDTTDATLRWAADYVPPSAEILVVHATQAHVTVRNGPSAAVARQMGGPKWAHVAARAHAALGDRPHDTIVDHGSVVEVLADQAGPSDVILLGEPSRRRLAQQLHRRCDATVVSISETGMSVLAGNDPLPEVIDVAPLPDRTRREATTNAETRTAEKANA